MTAPDAVWRVLARVHGADAASAVFALLDEAAGAVSAFETMPQDWRLDAYPRFRVLTPELAAQLALTAAAAGGALVEIAEERMPEKDWLTENQLAFPPLRVGRFFIYGSHYRGKAPAGTIGIAVDAATAFGTGEHPSTRGCLLALERLERRHRIRHPLDIGTGTGILAIAAAKLLRRGVLASDIDTAAVDVARRNAVDNTVNHLLRFRTAAGYCDRALRKSRYDLVLSNILARPLAVLAVDLAGVLAPGGHAVLSGLLRRQEPIVLAPHRGCGIVLESRLVIEGWSTLILRRRRMPQMAMGAEAPIFCLDSLERPLKPAFAGRIFLGSERGGAAWAGRAYGRRGPSRRFANGGSRCRRANDRRAPSARRRPGHGDATRQSPSRRK
jgi:ribosomal protein L11 methyltransferase